jgi:hypothetical protein
MHAGAMLMCSGEMPSPKVGDGYTLADIPGLIAELLDNDVIQAAPKCLS